MLRINCKITKKNDNLKITEKNLKNNSRLGIRTPPGHKFPEINRFLVFFGLRETDTELVFLPGLVFLVSRENPGDSETSTRSEAKN